VTEARATSGSAANACAPAAAHEPAAVVAALVHVVALRLAPPVRTATPAGPSVTSTVPSSSVR